MPLVESFERIIKKTKKQKKIKMMHLLEELYSLILDERLEILLNDSPFQQLYIETHTHEPNKNNEFAFLDKLLLHVFEVHNEKVKIYIKDKKPLPWGNHFANDSKF